MIIDITEKVLEAKGLRNQLEKFNNYIADFAKSSKLTIDYDKLDGEQWGRLLRNREVVLIFNSMIPLCCVDIKLVEAFINYMKYIGFEDYVLIEVQSWISESFSISKPKIQDVIHWRSVVTPTDKFSINDLWYATV